MASKIFPITVSWKLWERVKRRSDALGYKSVARYFLSMAVFDMIMNRPHTITPQTMNRSWKAQDEFIDRLDELRADYRARRGSLGHMICDAVGRELGVEEIEPIRAQLAAGMLREAADAGRMQLDIEPPDFLETINELVTALEALTWEKEGRRLSSMPADEDVTELVTEPLTRAQRILAALEKLDAAREARWPAKL